MIYVHRRRAAEKTQYARHDTAHEGRVSDHAARAAIACRHAVGLYQ
jgi:hypothetical protein